MHHNVLKIPLYNLALKILFKFAFKIFFMHPAAKKVMYKGWTGVYIYKYALVSLMLLYAFDYADCKRRQTKKKGIIILIFHNKYPFWPDYGIENKIH